MSRQKLYRRITAYATAAVVMLPSVSAAQSPAKKRTGPRAIAIVRWNADSKDRAVPVLIPVAILDEGRFFDAGLYKAAPSPMPLLAGFVYEAQDEGELLGYFTIKNQARANGRQNWYALGDWKSAAPHVDDKFDNRSQSAEIVRDRSEAPTGASPGETDDDRDLKKKSITIYDENGKEIKPGDKTEPSAKTPTLRSAPGSTPDDKSGKTEETRKKPEPDDPDRPTIRRQPNPSVNTAPPEAAPPLDNRTKTKPPADRPATGDATPVEDRDRPQLRRGKPTGSPLVTASKKPSEDSNVPVMRRGGKNPVTAETKQGGAGQPVPPRVLARGPRISDPKEGGPTLQLRRTYEAVAISDANVDPPQTFRYKIAANEYATLESKANAFALQQVDVFLKSIGRTPAVRSAVAPAKDRRNRGAISKPIGPDKAEFAEKQFEVLDLNHRNDPLLVFSGRERIASSSGDTQDAYVTYVARVDLDGNPRKLFSNTTTSDRLDVIPRLELIDAVDANGDGTGELLFRRVGDNGAEFAIYRVTMDGLKEMFHGGVAD